MSGQLSELEQLRVENKRLRERNDRLLKRYEYMRKSELVSHLLEGKFVDEETILRDLRMHNVLLEKDDYMIFYIRVLTKPHPAESGGDGLFGQFEQNVPEMEAFIEQEIRKSFECNVVHKDSGAICLVGLEREARPAKPSEIPKFPANSIIARMNRLALSLYDQIHSRLGIEVFIAISRPSAGIRGIPEVYTDVKRIMDYRELMELNVPVLCYHDFELENESSEVDKNYLLLEQDYLRQVSLGNYAAARQTMHRILKRDFVQTLPSLNTIRIETAAKLHMLLITLNWSEKALPQTVSRQIDNCLYQLTEETVTTQKLIELVDNIFDYIEQGLEEYGAKQYPKWFIQMLAYIEEHYRESELNVSSVSDRFMMTPSYLSRETKRITGSSLFDYIQKLRLQAAQSYLSRGVGMQEASELSGFGDTRSMRRAFQKYLNTNPSQHTDETGIEKTLP